MTKYSIKSKFVCFEGSEAVGDWKTIVSENLEDNFLGP